jgi:multidrug efflux pump subunit AcrA (membrane-fusion protein)
MNFSSRGAPVRALLAAGVMLVAVAELAHPQGAQPSGAVVLVSRATKACFSASIRVTGFLVPRREAMVNLDMEGYRISEVLVNEGDRVTSGQNLVRLVRATEGPSPGGAPPAGAQAQQAPPAMPATMILKAPAAGTIIKSTATVGGTFSARATDPLFSIAIDGEIELEAEVPSIHIPKLAPGQTARVEIDGGRELTGNVRLVPAEINPMSQLGRVRVSVERDPAVRLGSFARATIDASRSCGVSVPRAAVLYKTEGHSVQVVRNSVVETRRVRIGFLSDLAVEIREGVREGDLVVANAGTSLRDGDQVSVKLSDEFGQTGER